MYMGYAYYTNQINRLERDRKIAALAKECLGDIMDDFNNYMNEFKQNSL